MYKGQLKEAARWRGQNGIVNSEKCCYLRSKQSFSTRDVPRKSPFSSADNDKSLLAPLQTTDYLSPLFLCFSQVFFFKKIKNKERTEQPLDYRCKGGKKLQYPGV